MRVELDQDAKDKGQYLSRLKAAEIIARDKYRIKPSLWKRNGRVWVLLNVTCFGGWKR